MSDNRVDYRKSTSDVIYYIATLRNDTNKNLVIDFNETRPNSIVDRPNDYYMAVISFDIPNTSFSIFNYTPDTYYVTITVGGVDYTEEVLYIDRGDPGRDVDPTIRGVYYFQQFLDMMNNALLAAHTAAGLLGVENPPFMLLRSDGRFEIRQQQGYSGDVYFNSDLYKYFTGMESDFLGYNRPDRKDRFILNKDNGNNSGEYGATANPPGPGIFFNLNIQENKAQYLWPDIKALIITSTSIPVNKEYLGTGEKTTQSIELAAVSDFFPVYQEQQGNDRTDWVYIADTPRLIDIESDIPLRTMDFRVLAYDADEKRFVPVSIAPGETATVKFAFYKKSLYNNEYNGLPHFGKTFKESVAGIMNSARTEPKHRF